MSFLKRSANLIVYEWKRALAKKKFFILVILALVLQIGIFALFNFFFTNPPHGFDIPGAYLKEIKATMWLVGVLGPQGLFMPLIAIIIAGGSMSEEYEHGTADILLSKPITKFEYMTGKYLGGFSLLGFVIALTTALGVILAHGFFGPQESLQFAPHVYLALIYANLLFFSLTFMFSEVLRRTTLAMLATIGVLVASVVLDGYLIMMYGMTQGQEQLYLEARKWLPNWSVSNLPNFFVSELMAVPSNPFISVISGDSGDLQLAAAIIAVYTVASILVATIRLMKSDVTKKVD